MGFLPGIIILLLPLVDLSFEYRTTPSVSWPEEYHFNGEEINLVTGIVKPFEIWSSVKHSRSRIESYGGVIKKYYFGGPHSKSSGRIYLVHPSTTKNEEPVMNCDVEYITGGPEELLSSLNYYTYTGEEEHGGKQVQVWKSTRDEDSPDIRSEDTLYVLPIGNNTIIPIKNVIRKILADKGVLNSHVVINYYNFDSNIQFTDVDFDSNACNFGVMDFHTALKYLHPSIPSDVSLAFRRYKKHHDRTYENEEHEMRKKIFRDNWSFIVDHNSKNLGFTLAVNQFADRTDDELAYLTATTDTDPFKQGTHPFPHMEEEIEAMSSEIPENYDLRIEGVISPVKNQAKCGSCWAFAATAMVEGAYARANGGRLLDLSEQSLVDCAWAYDSNGCQGSSSVDSVLNYISINGIPTEREYGPYIAEDGSCHILNMTKVYKIKGYVAVTPLSPNALRVALYKYGPMDIGVMASKHMKFYNSGVFYNIDCYPGVTNHAVTLVGYGVRDGDLYWIVKNSWGEAWGEDGYILMSATNNNCNVMKRPYYVLV